MSEFRLFNTASRKVQPLQTLTQGQLTMYTCGPTVYSYAHIGNFRSFLTSDLIVRSARALGWDVRHVTNITDVGHLTEDDVADAIGEDRMSRALKSKEGERFANVWDLARYYTESLLGDWQALGLLAPAVRPRATEHMREQILAVAALIEKGHAYETEKGVYFWVPSFPDYGTLSGNLKVDELEQSEREVVRDPDKRDPRDFALWKKDADHLMQWYSPWGWGFPGWHIECSVMASAYLGSEIDLHAGGEDLIFPHHECEIAQAESLTGKSFARHWAHTRFLQVEGEKMSKRLGNFLTVRDLIRPESEGGRGIDPLALRLTLISGHYRKPFNFTFETLRANIRHRERMLEAMKAVGHPGRRLESSGSAPSGALDELLIRVREALLDDLNTPEAIAAVLEGIKWINQNASKMTDSAKTGASAWFDAVNDLMGIVYQEGPLSGDDMSGAPSEADRQIQDLVDERTRAKGARDYNRADALRDQLVQMGIELMDSPEGTRWKRKSSL